ncbi:MAG: YigZ family protein [Bacteroidales bacterium]|jgi:uncharacterized YigZ family protein|nr:YigZ family protein [Bacteroidales bacterium]
MESLSKPTPDCYRSIAAPSKGLFKDKGSKFLSFSFPVTSEDQIKEIITSVKKEYFDAKHHCYAYRLGHLGDIFRANDDGEPSSTAGRPILGQILSAELSDILIVVVRYFGGILLGTSGLIAAYKGAAADAIANSFIVEKLACQNWEIHFDYLQMNEVMTALKELKVQPTDQVFDEKCSATAQIRLSDTERFKELLKNVEICQKA